MSVASKLSAVAEATAEDLGVFLGVRDALFGCRDLRLRVVGRALGDEVILVDRFGALVVGFELRLDAFGLRLLGRKIGFGRCARRGRNQRAQREGDCEDDDNAYAPSPWGEGTPVGTRVPPRHGVTT
jgi:hypothetical protein